MKLNLGSTFKEFLNALNTNTEDTEGIINGTKKVKKLSLGEENELGNIEIIIKDDKKVLAFLGENIFLDVINDSGTSSLQLSGLYNEIYSANGKIHFEAGDGISLHSNKNDTARIELDATNDSENGEILIQSDFIQFIGEVDFTNATVIGLPSGGGSNIPEEVISYDSENNSLTFNATNKVFIQNNLNHWYLESSEYTDQFGFDLNDQAVMFYVTYDKENNTSTLSFDGDIVDFASAEVKVGNNLTIGSRGAHIIDEGSYLEIHDNSNLMLTTNDGEGNTSYIDMYTDSIAYSSSKHLFYGSVDFSNAIVTGLPTSGGGGSGSLDLNANYNWNGNHTFNNGITLNSSITFPNDGFIDVGEDYVEINHPRLTLSSDKLYIYANQSENSAIEILAGENDETSFYISPTGMDVTANNGNIDFTTNNQGVISFHANSEESSSYLNIYDTTIEYNAQNHSFFGTVDFSEATVTGLPSSGGNGGTLAIEVEELPTENIDDSKIYVLNGIKNTEVYYFDGEKYCTIPSVVSDIVGVTPAINHYVVNELPTNAEITDLQTFSVINCYIFNDVAYVYGNAGSGDEWLRVSTIFAQMDNPAEDKGRVYNLANTSVEVGLYVYYEEFRKFYLYSNNEWKEIGDKYILRLSGNSGVLSDEEYQKFVDNLGNTTIIVTNSEGTIVFNAIATTKGLYISTFSMGYDITVLAITPDKTWAVYTDGLSEDFIRRTGTNDIWADNTFNATNTFAETSIVEFKGEVDFTNANITGLPSGGGSADLTELKRVMCLLHSEKYTETVTATKFTSTLMGSIHKISKPSNDLLEASEYVLYSVVFEDTTAYPNATITIGNNGLINDSGTFSFTVQGSSIATGQNINVICVFVPSAFL